tara:strand:+ start:2579 stop:2857 length:279 start_codon:yes stop_codon:yes gene_type:complete
MDVVKTIQDMHPTAKFMVWENDIDRIVWNDKLITEPTKQEIIDHWNNTFKVKHDANKVTDYNKELQISSDIETLKAQDDAASRLILKTLGEI